jgi:hypothetical protein
MRICKTIDFTSCLKDVFNRKFDTSATPTQNYCLFHSKLFPEKKFANFFGSQCIKFDFFALEQKSNFFALVQKSNFLALVPENFRNHLFVDIYRTLK